MLDVSLPVMMHQHVDNLFKQIRLLRAEEASRNLVHGLFQLRQSVVILLSMVSEKGQITHHCRKNINHAHKGVGIRLTVKLDGVVADV